MVWSLHQNWQLQSLWHARFTSPTWHFFPWHFWSLSFGCLKILTDIVSSRVFDPWRPHTTYSTYDQHVRSSLGFGILPKDTSTCRPGPLHLFRSELFSLHKLNLHDIKPVVLNLRMISVYTDISFKKNNFLIQYWSCWIMGQALLHAQWLALLPHSTGIACTTFQWVHPPLSEIWSWSLGITNDHCSLGSAYMHTSSLNKDSSFLLSYSLF